MYLKKTALKQYCHNLSSQKPVSTINIKAYVYSV